MRLGFIWLPELFWNVLEELRFSLYGLNRNLELLIGLAE